MSAEAVDHIAAQLVAGAVMHQSAILRNRAEEKKHLEARDALIRSLRELDVHQWTYAAIGDAVGLSAVNVVKILRQPANTSL